MRRFTDRMSWEGRLILADVRRAERLDGAGSVKLGDVLERCAAIPEEEGKDVVRAWQLRTHALILSRSPIAEDDAELDRFIELGAHDRLIAESVLGIHEADTVDGALRSWAERAAACEEAETRRAGFRAL